MRKLRPIYKTHTPNMREFAQCLISSSGAKTEIYTPDSQARALSSMDRLPSPLAG